MTMNRNKDEVTISANEHTFRGTGAQTKDTECVLIYDPSTETFQLKQLNYGLRVNVSREKPKKTGPGGLALPNSGESSSRSISSSPSLSVSRSPSPERSKKTVAKQASSSTEAVKKPRKAAKKPSSRPQVSSKKPPSQQQPTNNNVNDNDEDDILGALANELEESLEGENGGPSDSETGGLITIIDRSSSRTGGSGTPRNTTFTPSPSLGTRTGPISLRGYASASRADEDELSSSEEE